jgi:hypothetical protein
MDEKRDYYFKLLRQTRFDISPVTVSNFYRLIADVYLKSGNGKYAIAWLRNGIALNPKLPVKKIMKQLEKEWL